MKQNLSGAVENYLKAVFEGTVEKNIDLMPLGMLAVQLKVTPGTVTIMVKRIAKAGFLEYIARKGCRLTETGIRDALRIVRKHRLIEYFLVNSLGMDWAEVHDEAELLEHCVSDKLLYYLDKFLDFPEFDPHGHLIPKHEMSLDDFKNSRDKMIPLDSAGIGVLIKICRVDEENPDFLDFLKQNNLVPDNVLTVVERKKAAGVLIVRTGDSAPFALGLEAAKHIYIIPVG